MLSSSVLVLILLFGFLLGYMLYELRRFRLGGVIAIPLIVIYSVENILILPIFIASIVLCYYICGYISEKTLIYGRRLLYLFLMESIIITYLMVFILSLFYSINLDEFVIFTIFPGLISFNMYRDTYDRESWVESVTLLILYFISVLLFAVLMLILTGGISF